MADFTVNEEGRLKNDDGTPNGQVLTKGMQVNRIIGSDIKSFGSFFSKHKHIEVKVASGSHTDYQGYFILSKLTPN